MAITQDAFGTVVVTGEHIQLYRLLTLRAAMRLELRGLRRHGRSAFAIATDEFGLRGSREAKLHAFDAIISARWPVPQ